MGELKDAYVVIDPSSRYQCLIGITFNKREAEAMAEIHPDYVIVQMSERDYPSSWRFSTT